MIVLGARGNFRENAWFVSKRALTLGRFSDSPFAGGIFTLRLQFPDQYPDKPPRVRFTCDMFHPNGACVRCFCDDVAVIDHCLVAVLCLAVFSDGSLCLDIIQDMWKPIYTVGMLLTSIQVLCFAVVEVLLTCVDVC